MSDPQRLPDDHPRRAEPLQPDKPGSGRQVEGPAFGKSSRPSVEKAKEQEDAAVDNAREGYD